MSADPKTVDVAVSERDRDQVAKAIAKLESYRLEGPPEDLRGRDEFLRAQAALAIGAVLGEILTKDQVRRALVGVSLNRATAQCLHEELDL